jgi:diguanylate cyclase (GGDEF)-like protein
MIDRITRPIRESLSSKIIVLVSASVIVTAVVVGIVTIRSTRQFLTEQTAEKFRPTLHTTRSKIKIFYERQFNSLTRLGQSKMFIENLERLLANTDAGKPDTAATEELNKYLRIVHKKFPVYDELLVLTKRGDLLAAASLDGVDEAEKVLRERWEDFESVRLSSAEIDSDSARVYQWLFIPVGESDELLGDVLMVARINLEEIARLLQEIHLGKGGDLYILDDHGRYLTRPRFAKKSLLYKKGMQVPTRDEGFMEVVKRTSYGGRTVFGAITQIEETGWWIVYEENYEAAIEPALNTQARMWVAVFLIGAAFIVVAFKIVHSMMRPVHALKLGAERINEGLVGVKIPRGPNDEIGMMIDTFNEMAKTITLSKAELQYKNKMLNTQNDQLQDMNRKLEELSITDGLTGLFNHRHFWNILNTELTRVNLYKGDLALLLIDLDDFKRVNDQFGHAVGDLLLQTIARILKETVRDTDIVARYGGEEFAILLPDTDRRGVENVSEKLRQGVQSMRFKVPETDITISVTISLGVSVFKGNRREFFNAADRALYLSKREGKNKISYALQA